MGLIGRLVPAPVVVIVSCRWELSPLLCPWTLMPCNVMVWLKAVPAQAPPGSAVGRSRAAAVSWGTRRLKVAEAGLALRMAGSISGVDPSA